MTILHLDSHWLWRSS